MTAQEVLRHAHSAGVILAVEDHELYAYGDLNDELREALKVFKVALIPIVWRLAGMRLHTEPVPCARADAQGGPGWCFSCGDRHEHPRSYGRCVICWQAVELYYAERDATTTAVRF